MSQSLKFLESCKLMFKLKLKKITIINFLHFNKEKGEVTNKKKYIYRKPKNKGKIGLPLKKSTHKLIYSLTLLI